MLLTLKWLLLHCTIITVDTGKTLSLVSHWYWILWY